MHSSSPTDSSRSPSSPDSYVHHVWPPRRPAVHHNNHSHSTSTTTTSASSSKSRRFYSSPLCEDSPDPKTPTQAYGLEQREPSIAEEKPAKLLRRVSHALDDIKEDFSLQLDSRGGTTTTTTTTTTAEKQRLRRRDSAFFDAPPVVITTPPSGPAPPPAVIPRGAKPESGLSVDRSRPMSILSMGDHPWSSSRRLSRRLSMLGSSFSQRKKRFGESISQPNLIGSSTPL